MLSALYVDELIFLVALSLLVLYVDELFFQVVLLR